MEKKNFKVDQRVVFLRTNSELDGQFGTILGKSMEHVTDVYIVLLDNPVPTHKAITIVEGCLEAI